MISRIRIFIAIVFMAFIAPSAFSQNAGNPVNSLQSSSAEGSHILKASSGIINGFSATSGATSGYVLIIDSATVPADGAVTPKFCYSLPANSTTGASWIDNAAPFSNGIVIVFSSTGCFTKTISNTAFFSAQVQ